jgi:tripartite-type tricarboxylate transporter receptor subunit TctC
MQARWFLGLIMGGLASLIFAGSAAADPVADFYRGKQVSIIIPSPPGGGYDLYARFLARYIGKHIPGNPSVIPRNMPGAGGIIATNHLANIAPPDGLTLGLLQNTNTLDQLSKSPNVKFDVRTLSWVGNMSVSSTICALSGPAKDISGKELLQKEVVVGGSTGSPTTIPLLLNSLAGTRFNVIRGYAGTAPVTLAMEKGEVNGLCGWAWDGARVNARDMLSRGFIKVAVDIGIEPLPELQKMGVPFLMDFVPEGDNKEILKIILSTQVYGRPFAAPPGVPADRLKALRDAFVAALKDPEMIAEGQKLNIDIQYLPPERILELIKLALDAPPKLQERAVDELAKAGFGGG